MLLKVYDQYKNAVGNIRKYTGLTIERELESGDKTLSFTYQEKNPELIQNEYYIETPDDRYVVKEIGISSDGYPEIVCQLDLESLEADMVESFSAVDVSIQAAANLALVGTGWLADTEGMDQDKLRSVATLKATPLTLLGKIRDAWMCELKYDSKNQVVYFRDEFGDDKGVFFSKELNLRKLKLTDDSYDYYTRIVPIGEDDLRINDVNGGVGYVENYQYSNKVKTLIWEDTNYTDAEALKEDAEAKLDDMSKPARSYSADVVDLAKERPEYNIMDFDLGDTITLLDQDSGIKDKQRIVKIKEYPDDPYKNSCELSNTTWTWEELQSKLQAAADAFEDITNADGSVNGYYVHGLTSDGVLVVEKVLNPDGSTTTEVIGSLTDNIQIIGQQSEEAYSTAISVVGDVVTISGELDVVYERVGTLEATSLTVTEADILYASIGDLEAVTADITNLYAEYAEIQSAIIDEAAIRRMIVGYGYITEADIETLRATVAEIQSAYISYEEVTTLLAGYASVGDLDAITINVEALYGDVANIVSVLSGEIGTGLLEAIHLTTDNAVIDEAVIVDALIGTVLADIIRSNIIYTDTITIMSENGGIIISGTTMQFSDSSGTVRLQLGEDADGNFTFVLYDETGTGIMIDSEGIHASAVPDGLIVNDMVADDANIAASKLDIADLTETLNANGDLILTAEQITIGGGTLDYALTEITQQIAELEALDGVQYVENYYAITTNPDWYPPQGETEDAGQTSILGEMVLGEAILGYGGESDWTTERLVAKEGEYLWYCQKITYTDGHVVWTTPTLITDDYIRTTVTVTQTELEVVQGQIEAKIWMTDIETATNSLGDQINTISEEYSDLTITINEIDERVGTLTTTVASDYEELLSEVSSITTQIGDINIEVQSMYSYVDSEVSTVSKQISDIDIKLGEIDIQVSDLNTYTTENISYLLDEYAGITVELGQVSTRVESVEQLAVEDFVPYYAVSTTPDWYPPHEVEEGEAAILGEMILGKAILGASGDDWSKDQPDASDDEYVWISWLVTLIDGTQWWTEPTLMTDERFKQSISSLTRQYAEIIVSLDGINLTLYSLQADSESLFEQVTSIDMELGSMSLTVSSLSEDLDATKLGVDAVQEQITAISMELDSMSLVVYDSGYGMASIVMTVGDKTETADVVTNAREAFENDKSEIDITAGKVTFESGTFAVNSQYFTVSETGDITATSGTIANWSITTNSLQTGSYNTSGKMYFGEDGLSLGTTFRVTSSGELTATSGTIGGFTITAHKIYGHNTEDGEDNPSATNPTAMCMQIPGTNRGTAFAAGGTTHSDYSDAAFRVTRYGTLYATDAHITGEVTATSGSFTGNIYASGGTIGGWTITQYQMYANSDGLRTAMQAPRSEITYVFAAGGDADASGYASYPFRVTKTGTLYAEDAHITGAITATSGSFTGDIYASGGTIGGFSVNSTRLYGDWKSGNTTYRTTMAAPADNLTFVFAAGGDASASNYSEYPFRVSKTGTLYTTDIEATGGTIGGWTINGSKIYNKGGESNGTAVMQMPSSSITYVFAAGGSSHSTYADCPFKVTKTGVLTAQDIHIKDNVYFESWEISGDGGISNDVSVKVMTWDPVGVQLSFLTHCDFSTDVDFHGYVYTDTGIYCGGSESIENSLRFYKTGGSYSNTSTGSPNARFADPATSGDYVGYSRLCVCTGSSIRYKNVIQDVSDHDISSLFDIPVVWFKYKDDYLSSDDERYEKEIPGFITEDWENAMPIAVDHRNGVPEIWNSNIVIPLMFEMIKSDHSIVASTRDDVDELKQQLQEANERIAKLEKQMAA